MPTPPDVAPFAAVLADLARDLRRGSCCLVVCDKGWTLPIFVGLKQRLQAAGAQIGYLDGRVKDKDAASTEGGVMLAAVAQMRWATRAPEADGVAFALPHLDIMTAVEGGWTTISREVIPLLYENAGSVWLGFQDPSVTLPALVEKVFTRRYVIATPYRTLETVAPGAALGEETAEPVIASAPEVEAPAVPAAPPEEPSTAPVAAPEPEPYPWEPGAQPPTAEAPAETTSSPDDPG